MFVLPFGLPAAHAYDFYGIQMKSESFSEDLVWKQTGARPAFESGIEGTDPRIEAFANFHHLFGLQKRLDIRVVNGSDKPLATGYLFTEYQLVLKDGRRHLLTPPEALSYPATELIPPKGRVTLTPGLGALRVKKEEIDKLIVSFDMGATKIVLLPVPRPKSAK